MVTEMELREGEGADMDPVVVRLRKASPKVTGGVLRVREAALADGLFSGKVKVLGALAVAVAIRCEPCVEMYIERAVDAGATFEEVVEFLNVAMAMQGCPGEAWALKALDLFQRLAEPRAANSSENDSETQADPEGRGSPRARDGCESTRLEMNPKEV